MKYETRELRRMLHLTDFIILAAYVTLLTIVRWGQFDRKLKINLSTFQVAASAQNYTTLTTVYSFRKVCVHYLASFPSKII